MRFKQDKMARIIPRWFATVKSRYGRACQLFATGWRYLQGKLIQGLY